MKKLIALIALCTFVFTSTFVSTAFAADEGPARPTPGTAETPQYEIRSEEPEAVEAGEATPAATEEAAAAEAIATSEATNAYISGVNAKYIEGAVFVTALVVMAIALSSSDDDSTSVPPGGHDHGH